MTVTSVSIEEELSRFTVETAWESLPKVIQDRAFDLLIDAIANAMAGRTAESTASVWSTALALCGRGDSPIIAGPDASMTAAVFANGHQTTVYTMCDVYRPALCHITPEVVPPLLAVAAERGASGRDVLVAMAIGLEVTARLGAGLNYDEFRARGWHAPGVIGPFGAAAAVGRLLEFDDVTLRRAFGLAGSQASGTFAALGTPAVKFHQARGAVSGLWAAQFAEAGLGGSELGLTHPDGGLLSTYTDGGRPDAIIAGLGDDWELTRISLRRWPAASSLQALVECVLALASDHDASPEDTSDIVVALPPVSYAMCGEMGWDDELRAMQSARFMTAVVLTDGECWTEQSGLSRRADTAVADLAARVDVIEDPTLPLTGARLDARIGAESVRLQRDEPLGSPERPLSRADVRAKLERAAQGVSVRLPSGDVVARIAALPDTTDVSALIHALAAPPEEGLDHDREH